MACSLNFPVTQVCTKRFGLPIQGRTGRGPTAKPAGIVVHQLPVSMTDYDLEQSLNISVATVYTDMPRSVHYVINEWGAAHEMVIPSDTAWGLNGIITPTPEAQAFLDSHLETYPDRWMLHVAFALNGQTAEGIRSMTNLICCLALQFGITVDANHIFQAGDFNENMSSIGATLHTLIGEAATCVAAGGVQPPPPLNIPVPYEVIRDLQRCCTDTQVALAALTTRVASLETWRPTVDTRLTSLEGRLAAVETGLAAVANFPTVFNDQITVISRAIAAMRRCTDKLCPDTCSPICGPMHYLLDASVVQVLTPIVPVRVNFPIRVSDVNPAQVMTGPLWTAYLDCNCKWNIDASVLIALSEWCAGKSAWLDMVNTCGGRVRIATYTSQTAGPQSVELTGSTSVTTPPSCSVYFEVGFDDTSTPTKTLTSGSVRIACAS